ncbi:MAG: VWA domain-containing protein [Pseudohongiellaceae bacterium]
MKRRAFNPVTLAFLDVMSCGFGAVVLLFLILDHSASLQATEGDPLIQAEVSLLEEEVLAGREGLVQIRNTIADVSLEVVTAEGLIDRVQQQIEDFMQQLAELEGSSAGREEDITRMRVEIAALEEELLRLQESALEREGNNAREFLGEGDRQYLSGLYLGGNRIMILVDNSASMLDETLVNIIRTRNLPDDRKIQSPKWKRVVRSVDWISSQLPITSRYQIYSFNEEPRPILAGSENQWLEVADREQLDGIIGTVEQLVPENGTNLAALFQAIAQFPQLPDNIFLITDGLPTLGLGRNSGSVVSPSDRLELYQDAVEQLPEGIPVNIILMPLEGDPSAAAAYWQLSQYTQGSFMTPSRDWP